VKQISTGAQYEGHPERSLRMFEIWNLLVSY